ncbi:hypothetical protein HS088_TW15G00087 [Tripterygium wilfordii]|uniref:Inositol polyphosphate-related phosphatase domain-containing protein n=1 Tax=Tripterygium wilfordii TaxID=458696 RepID=A0A7J7CKJ7_TRIWF|nr:hypothetical protein HS088_TW15G00087 [Tripterygium wilfordii]
MWHKHTDKVIDRKLPSKVIIGDGKVHKLVQQLYLKQNCTKQGMRKHMESDDMFQEIVPLNARNGLASGNRKISTRWNNIIRQAFNKATLTQAQDNKEGEYHKLYQKKDQNSAEYRKSKDNFQCLISKQMVGVFISAWVRSDIHQHIRHPSVSCVGCGIMGCLGNKGSVSVRFCLHETSFCFVCSHLASGGKEGDEIHRNTDATEILSQTRFPQGPLRNLPQKILNHDRVIWLGNLNYRIYLPEATTRSLVHKKEWNALLENDQLKAKFMKGHVFEGWKERVIEFAPTYKYYPNSGIYHGWGCRQKKKGKKRRAPAWCDRIIWFGEEGLKQIECYRAESGLSDHRPIREIFTAEIEVLSDAKEESVVALIAVMLERDPLAFSTPLMPIRRFSTASNT